MMRAFLRFLLVYAVIGVLGSVVLVLSAPYLRKRVPESLLQRADRLVSTNASVRAISDMIEDKLHESHLEPRLKTLADKFPFEFDFTAEPPASTSLSLAPASPGQVQGRDTSHDTREHWGMTFTPARAFDLEGQSIKKQIAPGRLVEISELRRTRSGRLAMCRIPYGDGDKTAPFYLRAENLVIRQGALQGATDEERKLVKEKAAVLARLDRLKRDPMARLNPSNPQARDYARAYATYRDFWKRVRAIEQKRDASAGPEHMRYSDELRAMKGEDIRLGQALESVKAKYDRWDAAHPSQRGRSRIADLEARAVELDAKLDKVPSPQ